MPKLTDSQLIVLSKAAGRDDGVAVVPRGMSKAAAGKIGSSLVARKLMREIRSEAGMPIWREDNRKNVSLVITRAGRDAIGVGDGMNASDRSPPKAVRASAISRTQPELRSTDGGPRHGSKQALVIEMLSREDGASLDALIKATGWLPHTTRAALTGLRKRGYALERLRDESKGVTLSDCRKAGGGDRSLTPCARVPLSDGRCPNRLPKTSAPRPIASRR